MASLVSGSGSVTSCFPAGAALSLADPGDDATASAKTPASTIRAIWLVIVGILLPQRGTV